MKNIIAIPMVLVISIAIIFLLEPLIDDLKNEKNYSFVLDTADGEITKDDFKGKVVALYFGYTFCPDVCPTSLSSLSQALNSFDSYKIDNFVGIFVSVDPQRDTLPNLKEYAKYFNKNFIGATSNKENIDDIVKRYGSHYEKVTLKGSAMDYSVAHTSYIYIFDKSGKFITKIDHFSNPEKIKDILQTLL
ncbi:SCO family protein [Arcobacter lanthieri]|uniref:SCO family protein n=1 Tax=Aliarcobacter lanthieri TaxID=1355374 RepID=UPI0019232050|nr:SCO family protein [Aliarcobacter lanthieri]MBL3520168.1 SCO family protein [Aliarcobacter lanthieri]